MEINSEVDRPASDSQMGSCCLKRVMSNSVPELDLVGSLLCKAGVDRIRTLRSRVGMFK